MNTTLASLLLLFSLSVQALAEQYLSESEALALAFDNPKSVRRLELSNREPMAAEKLKVFVGALKGGGRGAAFIDEVIGKHRPITYMVVVDSSGEIRRIEILEYREAYGGEIRGAGWRAQFRGKTTGEPLRHDEEIENIAGATLSCKHVTQGVNKILEIFDEEKEKLFADR